MNSVLTYFNIKLEKMKMNNVGIQIQKKKHTQKARNNKTMRIDIAKKSKKLENITIRVNLKNF